MSDVVPKYALLAVEGVPAVALGEPVLQRSGDA
jgi:hypothetical protein